MQNRLQEMVEVLSFLADFFNRPHEGLHPYLVNKEELRFFYLTLNFSV